MLRLALEIPTSMLERWTPLTDLDFILAHKVLQDPVYAKHFRDRPKGRELILDNSTHEFATKDANGKYVAGKPLPLEQLVNAAKLCRADMLIAPDVVNEEIDYNQIQQNIGWMQATVARFEREPTLIGGVLCGHTKEQRNAYLNVSGALDVLCFTFHDSRRLQWWSDFVQHESFHSFKRIHILGVSTLTEMSQWFRISEDFPGADFSIDTTKAVKWGAQLKKIDELKSLRGGPIDAKAVLELKEFSEAQIACVEYNIDVLKKVCRQGL